jgi:prepilin-type N-terminal cleavage/methylation domain-containing protein
MGIKIGKQVNRNRSGFTIVELLIVIVVIAVLAAISIVTYRGISERAESTKVINQASAYIKGLKLIRAETGERPVYNTCIAPQSETTVSGSDRVCPAATYWKSDAYWSPSVNEKLAEYSGIATPVLSRYNNTSKPAGLMWFLENYYNDNRSVLYYTVGPNTDCGLPNVLSPPFDEMTLSGAKYTLRTSSATECMIEIFKY